MEIIAAARIVEQYGAANVGEPTHAGRYSPPAQFPPLAKETRSHVPTEAAAYYLNRRPQTLRGWACNDDGPIRPLRLNGRLAWPVAELRRLLEVSA